MTKDIANQIKKIIKNEVGDFTFYFNSKKEELRITTAEWQDGYGKGSTELDEKNVLDILTALTKNGLRPKYRRDGRKYQGFINCRYIVFE